MKLSKNIKGKIVAQARATSGLSQSKMADLLYKSARTVQDWEHDRRKMGRDTYELFLLKTGQVKIEDLLK